MNASVSWESWTYEDWNARLVDHYFHVEQGEDDAPVLSLPASPEDLWLLASRPNGILPTEVAEVFAERIREKLVRRGFCTFCEKRGGWTSESVQKPHFFAMLWMTCLVAWGYPTGEGAFFPRLWDVIGKSDNCRHSGGDQKACLAELWSDFARWTECRHDAGDSYRKLQLPPPSPSRVVIGVSHFLAFPNRRDRNALARVLWDVRLVGFEPPIVPVISALEENRRQFTQDFLEDLDAFTETYERGSEDPRASAFWRAVRQEATNPSVDPSGDKYQRGPKTALVFYEQDGLLPLVACDASFTSDAAYEVRNFDDPIVWQSYLTGANEDLERPWRDVFERQQLVSLGTNNLIGQGVLVLQPLSSTLFEIATGGEVNGCTRALVRRELVEGFRRAFGGQSAPSRVPGWCELSRCTIRQLDALPEDLRGVTLLLRTMSPPSLELVGGIRVPGGFWFARPLLPRLRAPGAVAIEAEAPDGRSATCSKRSVDDDWVLPKIADAPGSYALRATWSMSSPDGSVVSRVSEGSARFVREVIDDRFKPVDGKNFYVESAPQAEADLVGREVVPLGITTRQAAESADLLEADVTARYLGAGLGEMSLEPAPGFEWLVIGNKNSPEMLVFIGDPHAPTEPAARRSPEKNDRRLWKAAFQSKKKLWRRGDGSYARWADAPAILAELPRRMLHHEVPEDALCKPTRLDTIAFAPPPTVGTDPATQDAVDALAARSVSRAGLPYQHVHDIVVALTSVDDPIFFQQVLRAWCESGMVDLLRHARTSHLMVCARRPRFVMRRRGPEVEASLVGLLTSVRKQRLEVLLGEHHSDVVTMWLHGGSRWQPATLRIRTSLEKIAELSKAAELDDAEWLAWPDRETIPRCLGVAAALAGLPTFAPPDAYRFEAEWDWTIASFFRQTSPSSDGVQVERRSHVDTSTIYVVLQDRAPRLWTYHRGWALLAGYALRGEPPFLQSKEGWLVSRGRAPVGLPLVLGRLCTVIGEGLPGPVTEGARAGDLEYVYPFGRRLFELVERAIPSNWYASKA